MYQSPEPSSEYDHLFKLVLIGNSGVGKSCMLMRYAENTFTNNFYNTIGVDFVRQGSRGKKGKDEKEKAMDKKGEEEKLSKKRAFLNQILSKLLVTFLSVHQKIKTIQLEGKQIKLQIWDTAGQDRFKTITTNYYRGAHGIVVVYDVTDKLSFENVKSWMSEIEKYAQENVSKLLIGNKSDLAEKRQVSFEEGQQLASQMGIKFIETSAKNSNNIDTSFESMSLDVLKRISNIKVQQDTDKKRLRPGNNLPEEKPQNSNSCC